jgi:hypothetical protein
MRELIEAFVFVVVGFGLGRIKNVRKLAHIKATLDSFEAKAGQEVKSVIAAIRAHL